jgi:NAD(P)H-hydrate epimerase
MASGGMGDVLTGVSAALIAQGRAITDSARLAAWICGRAAELAIRDNTVSQESLTASDVIDHLGRAFLDLRADIF